MTKEEFKKHLKHELSGRTVDQYEILSYESIIAKHKLDREFILIAVQFARIIKGNTVRLPYILTIINDWLTHDIRNPGMAKAMLQNKSVYFKNQSKKPTIEKHQYTKAELDSLFDNLSPDQL